MQPHERDIAQLMQTGVTEDVAEVLVSMSKAYIADMQNFDEEYWIYRLGKAGLEEKKARAFALITQKPHLVKTLKAQHKQQH